MIAIQKHSIRLLSAFLAMIFFVMSNINIATACMEAHEPDTIYDYDLAFLGKVIDVNPGWTPPGKPEDEESRLLVTFKVLQKYNGVWPWQKHVEIIVPERRGLFEVGETGLVIASFSEEYDHHRMSLIHLVSICGSTPYYQNKQAMREAEFRRKQVRFIRGWALWAFLITALLTLLLWKRRTANITKTARSAENPTDRNSDA